MVCFLSSSVDGGEELGHLFLVCLVRRVDGRQLVFLHVSLAVLLAFKNMCFECDTPRQPYQISFEEREREREKNARRERRNIRREKNTKKGETGRDKRERDSETARQRYRAVSYTHLTLPTKA